MTGHIGALDGVRAVSIILVILTHTFPLGPSDWRLNGMAGPMGMSLFFCLSGFLIVSILHRDPDPAKFLVRRVLRIVPALFLYVLLMQALFGIGWRSVAENLLFVTNYSSQARGTGFIPAPMSHLWSLSVEMHFYVAIGLLTALLGRRALWFLPPAALIVTGIRIDAGAYTSIATHLRVDEILSGGILALVWIRHGPAMRDALGRSRGLAWGLVFGLTLLWMLSSHSAGGALNYLRPYFAASLVGVLISVRLPILTPLLECGPAAYVARISYALYIWHPLMIWGWMNEGSTATRYLLKRPFSWLATWAAAHASTYWWEMHWQDLARRMTGARRPATNA